MDNSDNPLISCCFVVQSNDFFQKSISCFLEQTYLNKELIVVCEKSMARTLGIPKNDAISIFAISDYNNWKFYDLINHAITKSNGQYICFWASNNWYHSVRLEYQYEAIKSKLSIACTLNQKLLYDNQTCKAFVSAKEFFEDTLFFSKELLNNNSQSNIQEKFQSLIQRLIKNEELIPLQDVPNLCIFLRGQASENNINNRYFSNSFELDKKDSQIIRDVLFMTNDTYECSLRIDKLLGKNLLLEEKKDPNLEKKIQSKIHLLCKTKDIPEKYQNFYQRIVSLHPDWEIIVYDDDDALQIVQKHFPELLPIYQNYEFHIQRLDIFRILIVYLYGGFYMDMDVYILKNLEDLRYSDIVLGEERTYTEEECKMYDLNPSKRQIANYMFGGKAKHPFWLEVLREGVKRFVHKINKEGDILYTTGPWLLSDVYYRFSSVYNEINLIENKFRLCLKFCNEISCRFGDYAVHWHLGSWRWHNSNPEHLRGINISKISSEEIHNAHLGIENKICAHLK
ncbi:MAG: glycosyltransferase [Bacteroidota bacterium]